MGTRLRPDRALGQEPVAAWGAPRIRWLSAALVLVSAIVLGACLLLAAAHVDDRYRLDHVSGARIALARYVNDGTLYPELVDGQFYGGSRFMPLPVLLHAAAARLTGEYLVSGKLLGYGAMIGLLALTYVLLRRLRCPPPIAVALVALIVATRTGLAAAMDLRADTLPLLLQVSSVAVVAHRRGPTATFGAAALAAIALFCKLNAVWAPLAIGVWLLLSDRRRLAWFAATYAAIATALLVLFIAASDGRILENVFGLSTAGVQGAGSMVRAPYLLVRLLVEQATGAWALLPAVTVAAWLAVRERQPTIWLVGLLCCLGELLVVLTDIGTGWNQLVDLVVLTALVVGQLAGRLWPSPGAAAVVPGLIAIVLLWVNLGGLAVNVAPDLQPALAALRGASVYSPEPLAGRATATTRLLSEDPYVAVSLGQRPVVLDPFMLLRIGRRDPAAVQRLVDRIHAREFALVVLVVPLQPVDQQWWNEIHFGREVAEALAASYEPAGTVEGYFLYRPAPPRPTTVAG
jgi:hypothetical protein